MQHEDSSLQKWKIVRGRDSSQARKKEGNWAFSGAVNSNLAWIRFSREREENGECHKRDSDVENAIGNQEAKQDVGG